MGRSLLIALGAALLAGGVLCFEAGQLPAAAMLAVWGLLIIVGTLYERFRYKPLEAAPLGRGWTRTAERFIDGETGKPVTVYVEDRTGERKYVAD